MNSQGCNRPVFTSAESASTMWVCGEIGYAAMTSGRQQAIASATALDPSICLGMDRLQQLQARRLCRGRVGLADRAGEALADRRRQRARRRDSRHGGQRAEQRRTGHRASKVLSRQLARRDGVYVTGGKAVAQLSEPELVELAGG